MDGLPRPIRQSGTRKPLNADTGATIVFLLASEVTAAIAKNSPNPQYWGALSDVGQD